MADSGYGFIPVLDAAAENGAEPVFKPLFAQTAENKLADLDTMVARKKSNVENALINKVGLDPRSAAGQAVNLAASLASGASILAGNVATLPLDLVSSIAQASLPEDVVQAYNREITFRGTDADKALLDSVPQYDVEGAVPQTYRDRVVGVQGMQKTAQSVADFFDISKIVNTNRRDNLSDSIANETAPGLAQFRKGTEAMDNGNLFTGILDAAGGTARIVGSGLATAVQDPGAASEYVVENAPQLVAAAINPASMAVSNAGYGFDAYREGIRTYANENDGTIPDAGDRARMGAFAASAALAEQVGDISLLRGMSHSGKGIGAGVAGTASSVAREGITEGYQTYAENQAKDHDTSAEEIIESGVIGGIVGGTFHGGAAVVQRANGTAQSAAERIEARGETESLAEQARTSGNVDDLAGVDPARAVSVLAELSQGADQATVDQHIKQADAIQKNLAANLSDLQEAIDQTKPETISRLKAVREQLADSAAPEMLASLDDQISAAEAVKPAEIKAMQNEAVRLQKQLDETRVASERLLVDSTPDVQALEEDAQTGDQDAVNRVLTLTMANPDAVTTETATNLASNEALTDEQRDALDKFSAAKEANDSFKDRVTVNSDVLNGGPGFRGLNQYRSAIRMALADNNTEAAQSQVDSLSSFAESRVSKAAAITAAYEQVKGTNDVIHVAADPQGNWVTVPPKTKGSFAVSAKSFRVMEDVKAEANVLTKNALAFQALVNAKPVAPQVQAAPVVNTAEAPAVASNEEVGTAPAETVAPVNNAVNPTESVAEQTAEAVPETGELSAIKNRTGEPVTEANRQQVNLVGELFSQQAASDTDASARPLVSTPNFASAVRAGTVKIQDFMAQKAPLSGPQRSALNNFFGFTRLMDGHISNGFTRLRQPEFRFQDYSQFLINEDGTVDENAKTAIGYGMFTWLGENAGNLYNTDEGINQILNRDRAEEVSPEAYRILGKVGTREDVIANQVGARIVQALGLRANEGTPASDLARLETAMGTQAIGAMARAGLIKRTEISDATLQKLMGSEEQPTNVKHTFIALETDTINDRVVANEVVRKIREATTGSQSVVNKLMGVETSGVEPSYEPVKFDQKYAKRTNREIPKVLADALDKEGAKAHRVRQDMYQVWGNISRAGLYEIAGVVSTTDTPTHAYNMASREAKNAGLMDQVDNFAAFVEKMSNDPTTEGLEQPLYFGRSVWMPQRVGLNTNVINPQTSKVHRHMLSMDNWSSKVDPADQSQLDNFKLRVLEAFDTKTEAKATALVLKDYDKKVNTPEIQNAVTALAEILRGEADNNVANEAAILAGVKAGGANFHSLDALVSLAHQRNAAGQPFETTLMAEVDGVTNGPMLSLLMLGAKGYDVLNQGGFFELGQTVDGNPLTQFNDYKGQGNLDLYESTIAGVLARLGTENNPRLDALQAITGQLRTPEGNVTSKGRNVIKKPLTAMMFGSNTTTAVQGMAENFIQTIYSKMEDAAQAQDPAAMQKVLEAVNVLMNDKRLTLDSNMGIAPAMEYSFNAKQETALMAAFHELLGGRTEDALKDNYGIFMARRDTVNQTAQLAFRLYNAAYESLVEQAEANSPSIARRTTKNGQQVALSSLSDADMKVINDRLKDMQPILMTAMAKESNQLAAGMNMSKSKRELDKTAPFTSDVYFGEPVPTFQEDGSVMLRKGTSVNGLRTRAIDPGVAPFITGIHSTDSSIASSVYSQMNALNVHDALGVGLHDSGLVGQRLNEATYRNMLNYSTPSEMVSTLERVLTGLSGLMADESIAPAIQSKIKAITTELEQKRKGSISQHLEAMRNVARDADTEKLTMLSTMQAVGQYATDGGSYVVTDKDRAAAVDALSKIGENFTDAGEQSAAAIDELAKAKPLDLKATAKRLLSNTTITGLAPATSLNTLDRLEQTPEVEAVREAMLADNIPLADAVNVLPPETAAKVINEVNDNTRQAMSAWGEIGTPLFDSHPVLTQVLAAGNVKTARQLVDVLDTLNTDAFTTRLLGMIKRTVPASMGVTYVTKDTAPDGALGTGVNKSRGWYHQEAGNAGIYLKSPDFVESGLTPEVATHELVHAALAQLVLDHQGKNTEAGKAIADLERLRGLAQQAIENNGQLSSKYRNATSNIHELLAWGLTNQGFQQEVLAGIQVQTKANGLINGMREFVSKITAMLFRSNATKQDETGLGLLVAQSAGLFKAAAELRGQRDTATMLYEDAVDHINAMTSEDVLQALEGASPRVASLEHRTHLMDVISNVVTPLYGAYGAFKKEASADRAITPSDVYLKALNTGEMPFASRAMAGPFAVNTQEGFVLESVQAAMESAMTNPNTVFVRQAMQNLYEQARKQLKDENFHAGDWNTATQTEKYIAKSKRDFLFDLNSANSNEYLAQFAAMTLASEEVRNVMTFSTPTTSGPLKSTTIGAKVIELVKRVSAKLASLYTKVAPGTLTRTAMGTLVDKLVDIEAKQKERMLTGKLTALDQVEIALGNTTKTLRARAEALGNMPFFTKANNGYVKLAGAAIRTLAGDRVEDVIKAGMQIRDNAIKGRQGVIAGIFEEARGIHDGNIVAAELFKQAKADERARKDHIENTVSAVNASFKDNASYLTDDDRASLTRYFLRTNASALADAVGFDRMRELLNDSTLMNAHRTDLENQLMSLSTDFGYLTAATKDLAYHKTVGGNVSDNLMLSTANIAKMIGTGRQGQNVAQVTKILDQLLPVYAMSYVNTEDRLRASEVLRTESARTDGQNGVDFLLKLHSGLQKNSADQLFKGQEELQQSGYVPEIHDNRIEVLLIDRKDLDDYKKAGYSVGTNLQKDKTDQTNDDRVLVVRRGSGQTGLVTGALSFTGLHRKGSSPDRASVNLLNGNQVTSAAHLKMIQQAKAPAIAALLTRDMTYSPFEQEAGKMAPVLAPGGRIADYRYMMTEANRDALLDRDSSMDQVLGTLAGQIVDKVNTVTQNTDVVRAMHDQYRAEYAARPSSFVKFGKNSTDAGLAEAYRLLPESTKKEIRRVWRSDDMLIPAEQLNLITGYRKYSLTEPFTKPERDLMKRALPGDRNWFEQLFVGTARGLLGEKAALRVGQAEDIIQELMKEVKDILVIKNISTLVGNIMSNFSILAIEGVSPRMMIESHAVAIKGAIDWRKDSRRLMQLQQALNIGYIPQGQTAIENEIGALQDRLSRNPIKPLVDAGLMPTIVEDVEADDTQYSYKSSLVRATEKYTTHIPKLIRDAGKQVYMTHDTATYKFLSQTTQLSDLVARYAMYQHLTTRTRDPLSKADALRQAEESFVNYDLPSHRSIQYLNDMGLVMFTKYYLRIQKTIMRLVREKPARVLGMAAAAHYIQGVESVIDSSWMNKLGNNPLQDSALAYPGSLKELPFFKAL